MSKKTSLAFLEESSIDPLSMSNPNISSDDSRYDMRSEQSRYPNPAPASQRRVGTGHEGDELHQYSSSTELYNHQGFIPLNFSSPQRQRFSNQEWQQSNQAQGESGNHRFTAGGTALTADVPMEVYSNGQNSVFSSDQNLSNFQPNGRMGGPSLDSNSSRRVHQVIGGDEGVQIPTQSENILSTSSTERRHAGRSTNGTMASQSSGERLQSPWKLFGMVYYNDETKEQFKYKCHVDGCVNVWCARVQELKRHWESFHENSSIWCPIKGCERSRAFGQRPFPEVRKDKLKDHARNMHDIELDI